MEFLKKENLKSNQAMIWVLGFIILSFVVRGFGGTNVAARYASLQAVIDHHTFSIDSYKSWTDDWSTSPSGKSYSNKPPGPLFLTLPVYYIFDLTTKLLGTRGYKDDGDVKNDIGATFRVFFNFFTKVLPFSFLILYISFTLERRGVSLGAIHFFAISSLFGTTPSLFMNAFFGHGMASIFFLAMLWSWLEKKYGWVGLTYGFTLLSDFAAGAALSVIIPFLFYENRKDIKNIGYFIMGGVFPGLLWSWYHISCYGSPFLTSINFPNPEFVFENVSNEKLGGMFNFLPNWKIIFELIFGAKRGILVTQPWVIVLMSFIPFVKFEKKFFGYFTTILLLVLVWMNSSFHGWHAGASSGPRYLSIGLALMPLVVVLIYEKLTKLQKNILWGALSVTLLFRALTYATTILAPSEYSLWTWEIGELLHSPLKNWFRFLLSLSFFIGASIYSYKNIAIKK